METVYRQNRHGDTILTTPELVASEFGEDHGWFHADAEGSNHHDVLPVEGGDGAYLIRRRRK